MNILLLLAIGSSIASTSTILPDCLLNPGSVLSPKAEVFEGVGVGANSLKVGRVLVGEVARGSVIEVRESATTGCGICIVTNRLPDEGRRYLVLTFQQSIDNGSVDASEVVLEDPSRWQFFEQALEDRHHFTRAEWVAKAREWIEGRSSHQRLFYWYNTGLIKEESPDDLSSAVGSRLGREPDPEDLHAWTGYEEDILNAAASAGLVPTQLNRRSPADWPLKFRQHLIGILDRLAAL
ncbi:MAG: hypothetical protein KY432_12070, partial [Acidobacteria bacterium]|nr:hypothetical protein [Acidobacteriota bacterium]